MAIKKISYDLSGKIKEIASSSVNYDDGNNKLTVDKMSFSTASVGTGNGLLSTLVGGTLSASAGASDGEIVSWSTSSNKWVLKGDTVDLTNVIPTGDLTGSTYSNALVKSLSNVSSDTLAVANGGTGLTTAQVAALGTGSALLIGHGASAMTLIRDVAQGDLNKKPVLSANAGGTGWSYITQSAPAANADVQVFSTAGSFNWYKPANTKMIRVLVQGAGGGGGSGANRNSLVAALGGAGGAAGAFVDSGLVLIEDGFLTASVVVGSGGAGGVYPVSGTAGFTGSAGGLSSFGSALDGQYFAANGGSGGGSGSISSGVISSGGASVTASSNVYDNIAYNSIRVLNSSRSGSNNSTTAGISNPYIYTAGTTYYNNGGGASGGSLVAANFITNYAGGNGGTNSINSGSATFGLHDARIAISSSATSSIGSFTYPQDIFVASGGGGGASAKVTETFDSGTYALYHANLDNPTRDNSIYRQSVLSGSATGVKIISTGSLVIPQLSGSGWSDGVVSSSAWNNTVGTASSLYFSPGYNAGTAPWSVESWFYLNNTGSGGGTSCYLLGAGYNGVSLGCLLGISSSLGVPKLRIWSNGADNITTSSIKMPINEWCHILLQKSGSNVQAYINGTSSLNVVLNPTVNGTFGYSLTLNSTAGAGAYNFNGYAKEFRHLNRAQSLTEIQTNYTNVITNISGPYNDISFVNEYRGGLGGNGAWGSGGGGGGASTNYTGSQVQQGGNGGDGYVAVISYKDF